MVLEFKFPDVGEGIAEGEIVKWLVKEGDSVKADQAIVQIETDKAVVDIPAPQAGKILKINFKEGDTVKVGQTLVVIGGDKDKIPTKVEKKPEVKKETKKEEKKEAPKEKKSFGVVGELEEAPDEVVEKPHAATMRKGSSGVKVLASPAVRKEAEKMNIDLTTISGTGPNGMITHEDLKKEPLSKDAVVPQQTITVKKKYDEYGYLERVPLKGIRKTIAQNMVRSLSESAQVTTMEDIDVTKLWSIREKEKKNLEKQGVKLTFLPFVIKAVIASLKDNPTLNASIEGEDIILKKYYNIGVAVETDVGLMVPVVKIAESKNMIQIAKEIKELADKAKSRTIDLQDLHGSTFTITNYGSVGGTYGTPVINPGESAILGLGRIFDRVVLDDKGKLKNAKILPISLTFDHRILDGAQASRFTESLKNFLEEPDSLLVELK